MTLYKNSHSALVAHPRIPHDPALDNTLSLLAEGYCFMTRRFQKYHSDIFTTRLMLRKATCVRGEAAAEMFYQPGRFTRKRAIPPTTLMLLQGLGSAQTLDGEAHRRRKAMLMSLLAPLERQRLVGLATVQWRHRFARWVGVDAVVLHKEAEAVLCRAVCQWAGVAVNDTDTARRTAEFSAMIDGAGSVGPRNWRGLFLRSRSELWARKQIDGVRAGTIQAPFDSPLNVIARHRDADGQQIHRNHAAVELINMLRPTVAAARYITFGALAMHEHPHCRRMLANDDGYLHMFTQEVRRYFPFFTAIGGRASEGFDWHGLHFDKGAWVLLDLYGTNHHPGLWRDPEVFRPERFEGWHSSGYDLVPQGGGNPDAGHRCAGEDATIELVKAALRLLASEITYRVPPQDLDIDLSRMPAIPASRVVIDRAHLGRGRL